LHVDFVLYAGLGLPILQSFQPLGRLFVVILILKSSKSISFFFSNYLVDPKISFFKRFSQPR